VSKRAYNAFHAYPSDGSNSRLGVAELVWLLSLDKGTIERLADKHGIEPKGDTPWLKSVVGGSDDHSVLKLLYDGSRSAPRKPASGS
jgi:hypothetical protein